jgi:hypothetical protein
MMAWTTILRVNRRLERYNFITQCQPVVNRMENLDLLGTIVDSIDFSDDHDGDILPISINANGLSAIKRSISNARAVSPSNCTGLDALLTMQEGKIKFYQLNQ